MITMFTGNPRAGKTASMVDALIDLAADRAVYVHAPPVKRKGVDPFHEHLTIPHVAIDANNWPDLVPDGAILVIDEVQDLWRPRGPGVKGGPAITELETHGHRGIDIFVTSQKPRLVDSAVRDLVGRHVHIRDTGWLGRYSYEWPECSETLAWKSCVLKKRFKVPKRTFDVYKSANLHTKPVRGKTLLPLVAGGLVLATLVLGTMIVRSISSKTEPAATAVAKAQEQPATAPTQRVQGSGPAAARWPLYDVAPAKSPDPLNGRALQWEGGYKVGSAIYGTFGLLVDGERVATLSLAQLVSMGYIWTEVGPCVGVLRIAGTDRQITCGKARQPLPDRGRQPERPVGEVRSES